MGFNIIFYWIKDKKFHYSGYFEVVIDLYRVEVFIDADVVLYAVWDLGRPTCSLCPLIWIVSKLMLYVV